MDKIISWLFDFGDRMRRRMKKEKDGEIFYGPLMVIAYGLVLFYYLYVRGFAYLTRYFPFSLFYRDKIYHYEYRLIKKLEDIIHLFSITIMNSFFTSGTDQDEYFCYLYGKFEKELKEKDIEKMKRDIFSKYSELTNNFYIREIEGGLVKISAPREILNNIYLSEKRLPLLNRLLSLPK